MSYSRNGYTATERRMLKVLADGKPHKAEQLRRCLSDDLGEVCNIAPHLSNLRRKLRRVGEEIICRKYGTANYYMRVKLLYSPHETTLAD
jgi:hypothetical protein